jgi:acetate kinase
LVTAHLGAGASLAAVAFGRSVDTTMGFTPMEGLVMATRSGSVDPGLLLWVQRRGLSVGEVEAALELKSGLLGMSGVSGDLRRVIAAADAGNQDAQLAYEVYVYRIQTSVAAMCVAMGGIDGLVFTGGAGEASPRLRADACAGLSFLGVALDDALNLGLDGDALVSSRQTAPAVLVVEAREDAKLLFEGVLGFAPRLRGLEAEPVCSRRLWRDRAAAAARGAGGCHSGRATSGPSALWWAVANHQGWQKAVWCGSEGAALRVVRLREPRPSLLETGTSDHYRQHPPRQPTAEDQ